MDYDDLLVLVTMEAQSGPAPLEDPRADEDHTRVQVKHVNIKNSWLRGAEQAAAILRAHDLFSAADVDWNEMSQSGVDMFKPDGATFAGLGAGADDDEGDSAPAGGQAAEADASVDADGTRLIDEAIAEGAPELLRQVRTVIGDGGQPVSLDSACRNVRHAKLKKTTERNMRAGGASKTPARHAEPGNTSASAVHIRDPLIGFVGTPSGVTFVIGLAEQFKKASGDSGVLFIEAGELIDQATVVKLRVLRLRSNIIGSPGDLLFPVASSICCVDLHGPQCHVVNPDVVLLEELAFLKFEVEALTSSVDLWWSEAKTSGAPPAFQYLRVDNVPYIGAGGLPLFIAEGTAQAAPALPGAGAPRRLEVAASDVECPICKQEWQPAAMRQHMGYHILHEPSRVTAKYPCGFCGGESAQFSSDLSQLTGCAVWLVSGQPKMHCKLVGEKKYSIASAAKCSKSTPCTNRPMLCPMRQQKPGVVHWKLNMPAHWASAQSSGVPFVPDFAAQLETTAGEQNWTRVVGGERRKVP